MSKKSKKAAKKATGNTKAVLTPRQRTAVLMQLKKGTKQSVLAKRYGVTPQAIAYYARQAA